MKKIIIANAALMERHFQKIKDCARAFGYEAEYYRTSEEALPHLAGAEIVYSQGNEIYTACQNVKWFCSMSAGVDTYLREGVYQEGMILTNSSGSYGLTIAEHTVMVTLELLRRRQDYDKIVKNREWKRDLEVASIYGSRVTILGTGNIGTEIAKRFRAFSPAVITGVNRTGKVREEGIFDQIVPQDQLDRLLPETDLLLMALPGTKSTAKILSKERIAMLPETACVVNVGRGSAIDQTALLTALNAGKLRGAALDVFEQEPLSKEDPAWDCERLIITPHCSGNMSLGHTLDLNVEQFCRDFEHYCKGEAMEHLVDVREGY